MPLVYSNEVWRGVEYEVASPLMMMGRVKEGLEIVRIARCRYRDIDWEDHESDANQLLVLIGRL